jgi:hypothetical protein
VWYKDCTEDTGRARRREKKGRPRLRWKDDVEMDLRNMCVKRWRRTLEGTEWESVVRDANAKFKGLQY